MDETTKPTKKRKTLSSRTTLSTPASKSRSGAASEGRFTPHISTDMSNPFAPPSAKPNTLTTHPPAVSDPPPALHPDPTTAAGASEADVGGSAGGAVVGETSQLALATKEEESDVDDELDEYTLPQGVVDKEAEKALFKTFTPEQQARYEVFRRSKIEKKAMKKHIAHLTNATLTDTSGIIVAGVAKLFVGDMTERAREVMQEWGDDDGPIRPDHLREAYRRYKTDPAAVPAGGSRKRLFR
ncbi:hTAFII28-like protein conserved region-domain-containing protein [Powellomyces hirtus]|nr:hTAFII28-like protein conserved region-domain-containing protein [Powellomyces hirtus]